LLVDFLGENDDFGAEKQLTFFLINVIIILIMNKIF